MTNTTAKQFQNKIIFKGEKIMRRTHNPSETKMPTVTQTPIEIALQIDENGMTTASQLYLFL